MPLIPSNWYFSTLQVWRYSPGYSLQRLVRNIARDIGDHRMRARLSEFDTHGDFHFDVFLYSFNPCGIKNIVLTENVLRETDDRKLFLPLRIFFLCAIADSVRLGTPAPANGDVSLRLGQSSARVRSMAAYLAFSHCIEARSRRHRIAIWSVTNFG